jgi:hypothetical protein
VTGRQGGAAWLVWRGALHAWAPAGYAERREPVDGLVTVITPRAIVDVIRAGDQPVVHPRADLDALIEPHPDSGAEGTADHASACPWRLAISMAQACAV